MGSSSTSEIDSHAVITIPYHLTHHRTLSDMNVLLSMDRGSRLAGAVCQCSISNTRADRNVSDGAHGHANQNAGNVLHCYNSTINVGMSEEALRIQEWLSPLESHTKHHYVRNRRLDGVGDWVLQKDEFELWRKSQDGSGSPTLLCYGDLGVGKTYIRYKGIFQRLLGDADKELNQFISNRHLIRACLWAEYCGFVPLLRLRGTGGPIGGEYDRESTQAGYCRGGGDCGRNSECL